MKKKTKPEVSGNKREKSSSALTKKACKLTKLTSAALFSTPLRGNKTKEKPSGLLKDKPARQESPLFPIVGIGASAGGLEAKLPEL